MKERTREIDFSETITDTRNGETLYAYNNADEVVSVTAPAAAPGEPRQVTGYQYDDWGRLTHVTHADSTVTRYDYYPTGDLRKTWGSRTTPVEYTYDAQGRMKTMRTWKEFDQSSGAGTSGSATTTWNYDPQRGFLTSKVYPDSQTVSYTYDAAGRIQTRTWARGVVTTYGYNNAGDLASVTYSDDTPPVTLTWNRVGQKEEVSDGTGDYAWWYDVYGRVEGVRRGSALTFCCYQNSRVNVR